MKCCNKHATSHLRPVSSSSGNFLKLEFGWFKGLSVPRFDVCKLILVGAFVTASSGTAISTDFATLTCSEILSKILIRCVTWHWACDCSFRCFHEIGRYFDNKEQERAKTRARRHDRSQRRQERPKIDSFWGANTGFIDFQHYATLCSGNRENESFRLKILVWCLEPLRPSFLAVWFAIFVPVFMYFQWFWLYSVALALV